MNKKNDTVERTVMSVSISVKDKEKLKYLAVKHEMTSSALLSQWIKEKYEEETKEGVKDNGRKSQLGESKNRKE